MIRLERKHGMVLLDDEDAWVLHDYYVSTYRDSVNKVGDYYIVRAIEKSTGKGRALARLLLEPAAGMQADHINNDPLDNRRENLRVVDLDLQSANRRSNNPWGKGVDYVRHGSSLKPFRARIYRRGNTYRGPYRASPERAALDFNRMAIALWGNQIVVNEVRCVDMEPRPADKNCMFCNASCHCCCVCFDPPSAGMQRLFDTFSA